MIFFVGAMYIFVLQWPPALKAAIQASQFGAGAAIPFGTVFSCFMASCLLGSTAFGRLPFSSISCTVFPVTCFEHWHHRSFHTGPENVEDGIVWTTFRSQFLYCSSLFNLLIRQILFSFQVLYNLATSKCRPALP